MITSNIDSVMGKMRARSVGVRRELERAAHRMAPVMERESKAVLQEEIYAIPEKTSASGRKLWIRTGQLMAAEEAEAINADVVMRNTTPYAAFRYWLGVKGSRQVRPPQRSVQWQAVALKRRRRYVLQTRKAAVLKGLRQP